MDLLAYIYTGMSLICPGDVFDTYIHSLEPYSQ